jgi:hypothetical protein
MKTVYRVLVYLVALVIPVVIAACYGPAYRYRPGGKTEPDPRATTAPDGGVPEAAAP